MGLVLDIAFGITLGFIILFIILWLIGILLALVFGDSVMAWANGIRA